MLIIDNLTKGYGKGAAAAVDGVSLRIAAGSFFTLLGPSGCGKSTLLRSIAGLEKPDAGEIVVGGETVFSSSRGINVPTNRRRFGMVFQSYAVWPHMTVFENVAFPLQVQRQSGIRQKVMRALDMVGLADYHARYAPNLSGGQQQRVALARAVVAEPALLLLDEPLSNLDATLREQMRLELRHLQKRLGVTSIYVTHDQAEALSMSDQIAVMRRGKVIEIGEPGALYQRPQREFSANFIGGGNIIAASLDRAVGAGAFARVETPLGTMSARASNVLAEGKVFVLVRPENIRIVPRSSPPLEGPGRYPGTVTDRQFVGPSTELLVKLGTDVEVRALVPGMSEVSEGDAVVAEFREDQIYLIPPG